MVRHVDAIFSKGTFRPLEPLEIAEGTRVHLRVVDEVGVASASPRVGKIHSPKLARPEDVSDFVMEVREAGDARV